MGYIRKHKDSIKLNAEIIAAMITVVFTLALPFATIWMASTS